MDLSDSDSPPIFFLKVSKSGCASIEFEASIVRIWFADSGLEILRGQVPFERLHAD